MSGASSRFRWRSGRRIQGVVQWGALFLGLLLAMWAATQSAAAPQSILVLVLYVLTINFGAPAGRAGAFAIPVISLASLFVVGFETATVLIILGSLLAELAHPLWSPLWHRTGGAPPSRTRRLGHMLVSIASLAIAGGLSLRFDAQSPLAGIGLAEAPGSLGILAFSYAAVYIAGHAAVWVLAGEHPNQPWWDGAANIAVAGLLSLPFAYFGAVTFAQFGLPAFALFCLGVAGYTIVSGLSWQRRFIMEQQLAQFAALNRVGRSMRETLDLERVLRRTFQQATELVPTDTFTIALVDEHGRWERPLHVQHGQLSAPGAGARGTYVPDGFVGWVAEEGRVLDVDPENVHFAARHGIAGPDPLPAYWLGVPLTTADRVLGAMVLQREDPRQPFSGWSREVLLAIAGQASAAIENARLYAEIVRLLNRTDEALARRLDQLHALLDTVREAVILLDTSGQVSLINRQASALLDISPTGPGAAQSLEALAPRLGYDADALRGLLSELSQAALPSARSETLEWPRQGAGDRRRFLERVEAPVVDTRQAPVGWLMVFRDVTEERELAEWRRDVTRMIVHDLRNPITALLSMLGRLDGGGADAAESAELVRRARRSGTDLLDLIDSLMDIQHLEAGKLVVDAEAMRLTPLVEQVVAHMQPLAEERGVTLSGRAAADAPAVWGDVTLLRRVLLNLLENALKFTPASGHVAIEVAPEASTSPGHEAGARCAITDSGPGVPPDHRQRIFDRYTRVDASGSQVRGTGLGLTFCKLAVEAQGGAIWVEDAPGGGSRFVFTIPGVPRF